MIPVVLIVVGVLFIAACGSVRQPDAPEILPGQPEATALVWHTTYGMPSDWAPPPITWVDGQQCKDLALPALPIEHGGALVCAAGMFDVERGVILVRASRFAALAHEFMHAMLFYLTGDPDSAHARPEWPWVGVANDRLRAAGLLA